MNPKVIAAPSRRGTDVAIAAQTSDPDEYRLSRTG